MAGCWWSERCNFFSEWQESPRCRQYSIWNYKSWREQTHSTSPYHHKSRLNQLRNPQDWKHTQLATVFKRSNRICATITEAFQFSPFLGKCSPEWCLTGSKHAEEWLPEAQCRFQTGHGTVDMIFSLKQVQENCIEHKMPRYIIFVDFTKTFDTVSWNALWSAELLVKLVAYFHTNMRWAVWGVCGKRRGQTRLCPCSYTTPHLPLSCSVSYFHWSQQRCMNTDSTRCWPVQCKLFQTKIEIITHPNPKTDVCWRHYFRRADSFPLPKHLAWK